MVTTRSTVLHPALTVDPAIIAHQGGWDEILLIVGPIVVIALALRFAKRRVDRTYSDQTRAADQTPDEPGTPAPT